jgi:3-hydroxy-9,10-secoandrosta-1,3,5(10)-triene-9,17-dione monooxygenase
MPHTIELQHVGAATPDALDVSPAGFVRRAEAMVDELVARQAETEARTFYAEDTHEQFRRAGFYRMLVPREFGGYEVGIDTFFRVVMTLASGCPSTGWQYCFGHSHATTIGSLFDREAQAAIFAEPDFICAATIRPQGKIVQQAGGDWLFNGTFNYGSGSPYSTHFMSQAFTAGADGGTGPMATFVAPRAAWTRLEDWGDSLGLKGSGSHSVQFADSLVPGAMVLPGIDLFNHEPRGDSEMPAHFGRTMALWFLEPASIAVGTIRGALNAYAEMMRTKPTMRPPIVPRYEDPDYCRNFGNAAGKIAFAEGALIDYCRQWTELSVKQMTGEAPFTVAEELRLCLMAGEIIDMCWHVMESILFPTAGSSAARDGERMQRLFRDMAMARSHAYNTQLDPIRRRLSEALFATGADDKSGKWAGAANAVRPG